MRRRTYDRTAWSYRNYSYHLQFYSNNFRCFYYIWHHFYLYFYLFIFFHSFYLNFFFFFFQFLLLILLSPSSFLLLSFSLSFYFLFFFFFSRFGSERGFPHSLHDLVDCLSHSLGSSNTYYRRSCMASFTALCGFLPSTEMTMR